jgi:hypothetical protein
MAKFDLKKFLQVLQIVGPVVLTLVPGGGVAAVLIPTIIHAIGEAEQIKGAKGPEKKAHVMEIVDSAVAVANATSKTKLDPAEVKATVDKGIDTVISTIHVVEGAKVLKPVKSGPDA